MGGGKRAVPGGPPRASSRPGWDEALLDIFGRGHWAWEGHRAASLLLCPVGPLLPSWLGYIIDNGSLFVTPCPEMRVL